MTSFSRLQKSSQKKRKLLKLVIGIVGFTSLTGGILMGSFLGWMARDKFRNDPIFFSPFMDSGLQATRKPLQKYAFSELAKKQIKPSEIKILSVIQDNSKVTSYLFAYDTFGGTVTGQLNVPQSLRESVSNLSSTTYSTGDSSDSSANNTLSDSSDSSASSTKSNSTVQNSGALPPTTPVVVMLRGYYPLEEYSTGGGTRNAAQFFAENGIITVAPDFLGYGESDPDFQDTWEGRLVKPPQVIQLLETISKNGLPIQSTSNQTLQVGVNSDQIGMWAHSNGGQIAVSVLQILSKPIPTSLWAPVTAPFPYSVLHYSLDHEDEGKAQRHWVSKFEENYDVFDFSISQNMNRLTGKIQLHHGSNDDAAPISWSDAFEANIIKQNNLRTQNSLNLEATQSSSITATSLVNNSASTTDSTADNKIPSGSNVSSSTSTQQDLPKIELTFYRYPGADHNLKPNWDQVVKRDLEFFKSELSL
jgi:hypothetical protein